MTSRGARNTLESPIAVYEMHLGSWRRGEDGRHLTYLELAELLPPYLAELGFTHVEMMPVMEALKEAYPNVVECIDKANCHMALLSKLPFASSATSAIMQEKSVIRASLGNDMGRLTIIGVHATRPPYVA